MNRISPNDIYHIYLQRLSEIEKKYQQKALYKFTSFQVVAGKYERRQYLEDYFVIENSSFFMHAAHKKLAGVIINTACSLSFLPVEYRDTKSIREMLILKHFSQYRHLAPIYSKFFGKMESFTQKFEKLNNFAVDIYEFFELIDISALIFDLIGQISDLSEEGIFQSIYQYLLHHFSPDAPMSVLRESESIISQIKDIIHEQSDAKYRSFREKYQLNISFKIPSWDFGLMPVKITISSPDLSHQLVSFMGDSPFVRLLFWNNHTITFFVVLPFGCIQSTQDLLDELKQQNFIQSYSFVLKESQEKLIQYDSQLPSSTLIEKIFPFCAKNYFSIVDLRKKGVLVRNLSEIRTVINNKFNYQPRSLDHSLLEIILWHMQLELAHFPIPLSYKKYLQSLKKSIEMNSFIQHSHNLKFNEPLDLEITPKIIKESLTVADIPYDLIMSAMHYKESDSLLKDMEFHLQQLSSELNQKNWLELEKIADKLSDMMDKGEIIIDLAESIILSHYFRPEVVTIFYWGVPTIPEPFKNSLFYLDEIVHSDCSRQKSHSWYISITIPYFDFFMNNLAIFATDCIILNYPINKTKYGNFPVSYYNFHSQSFHDKWFSMQMDNLFHIFKKRKLSLPENLRLDLMKPIEEPSQMNYGDFYRQLNQINHLVPQDFLWTNKQPYITFLADYFFNSQLMNNFSELNKYLQSSPIEKSVKQQIAKIIGTRNFEKSLSLPEVQILVIINTIDQNTHPIHLQNDSFWSNLFFVGLVDYLVSSSFHESLHLLFYKFPESVWINTRSEPRRLFQKLYQYGNDAIKFYQISRSYVGINPTMLYPKDQISSQFLNLHMKKKSDNLSGQSADHNLYWTSLQNYGLHNSFLPKSLRVLLGFGVDIAVLIKDITEIPEEYTYFLKQHPMVHTFELVGWNPVDNSRSSPSMAHLAIISLNRYVNNYFNLLYKHLFSRFVASNIYFSHVIDYPWIEREDSIFEMISVSRRQDRPWMAYHVPIFFYRQKIRCFSLSFRIHLIDFLNKRNYWEFITPEDFNVFSKHFTELFEYNSSHLSDYENVFETFFDNLRSNKNSN